MRSVPVSLILTMILTCLFVGDANAGELPPRESLERLPTLQRAAYFEPAIIAAARREKVDANLLWTIAYLETRFRPWLTSPKKARGLMQFMPLTAAAYGLHDPYDPTASINAAAQHLKHLTIRFQGRADLILAAYNAGETRVAELTFGKKRSNRNHLLPTNLNHIRIPPYRETRAYVALGLRVLRILNLVRRFSKSKGRRI